MLNSKHREVSLLIKHHITKSVTLRMESFKVNDFKESVMKKKLTKSEQHISSILFRNYRHRISQTWYFILIQSHENEIHSLNLVSLSGKTILLTDVIELTQKC